ncbi:MAG: F0F1 ATP synthase subunit gamma [Methylococcales bacterium]|nr:F0F1 ATP synthase subunit gamma [Methylococcales bacterium]MDD5753461.1 F0F1 ATP synthase subunit gamma [Methylococcales bacterium]
MSRSRELQLHITQLEEIRSILNAMKNLAFMAVYKLTHLQRLQSQVVAHIEDNAADFMAAYPDTLQQEHHGLPVCIVVGSERGFCGDFNESLLDSLTTQPCHGIIAIGSRLIGHLESYPYNIIATLSGANVEEEVPILLERLFARLTVLTSEQTLIAVYHDQASNQVKHRQILPFSVPVVVNKNSPRLNLPAEIFFSELLEQYLLAVLHEIIYLSLLTENCLRLQHLDGAVSHLDEQTQKLHRKSQVYRQEEITEEIEVILLNIETL